MPTRFSKHFHLRKRQAELPFVDVFVDGDVPLFVDPYAFKVGTDEWSIECNNLVVDFFENVLEAIRAPDDFRAAQLLYHLHEPNSTRLGFSEGRPQGRGIGGGQAADVFNRLKKSRAAKTGILRDLSDCELLIPGISNDKISDMTINVIRDKLIKFTEEQCRIFNVPTQQVQAGPVWDPEIGQWKNGYANLPVYRGRPILLVPKMAVRYQLAVDHQEYYSKFVLDYLQQENLNSNSSLVQVLKNGRRRVTKKSLEELFPRSKEFLLKFSEDHPEVLRKYKSHISSKNATLTDRELDLILRQGEAVNGVTINIVHSGGKIVQNKNVVHGDNVGGAVGGGKVNARKITAYKKTVQKSHLPKEVKDVLLKARQALEDLSLALTDQNDAADALANLTSELEQEQKNPGRIRRFFNRIQEIAQPVATVLSSAKTIFDLVHTGAPMPPAT
jgi:hypothetical protein